MPVKTDTEDQELTVDTVVEIANKVSEALDGEELDRGTVQSYINQVLPEVIHNDRVAYQNTHGWTVGAPDDEFDEDKRIDPELVPYGSLLPDVRVRDAAVYAVVQALVPFINESNKPVVPLSVQTQTPRQRAAWEEENDVKLKEVDGKLTVVEDNPSPKRKTEKELTVPSVSQS